MSALCDLALAFGIAFSACVPPDAPQGRLPADDGDVWAYQKPEPPPQAPPPPPELPPVVIEKTVYVEVPTPEPVAQPAPPPPPLKQEPDWTRIVSEAGYARRAVTLAAFPEVPTPVFAPPARPVRVDADPALPALSDLASATPELLSAPDDFLDPSGRYKQPSRRSSGPVDNSRIVTTDRYIRGVIEGSVNSQISGEDEGARLVIQVVSDVYSYHDRYILIPKGSRLVCGYQGLKAGETRLAISCGRVLLSGSRAEIYQAAAGVHDAQDRAGVAGDVDNRFWEKYGTAFILAGISTAVRLAAAGIADGSTNAGGNSTGGTGQAVTEGAGELSEKFGEITAAVLEETVNLNPVITIPQGTRVLLSPGRDWLIHDADKTRNQEQKVVQQ